MIDPEDDGCSQSRGRYEGMCGSVVAGVDTPPVLEVADHVLDHVVTSVEDGIVRDRHLATFARWDAGRSAARCERLGGPVDVIPRSARSTGAVASHRTGTDIRLGISTGRDRRGLGVSWSCADQTRRPRRSRR